MIHLVHLPTCFSAESPWSYKLLQTPSREGHETAEQQLALEFRNNSQIWAHVSQNLVFLPMTDCTPVQYPQHTPTIVQLTFCSCFFVHSLLLTTGHHEYFKGIQAHFPQQSLGNKKPGLSNTGYKDSTDDLGQHCALKATASTEQFSSKIISLSTLSESISLPQQGGNLKVATTKIHTSFHCLFSVFV